MRIDKDQILQLLRDQGRHDDAGQAQRALPDQVDTDQHGGLLARYGINVGDLVQKFGGGLRNLL